jgi:mannose-6-phosphate isomerase-like protein (cupin superfamily)
MRGIVLGLLTVVIASTTATAQDVGTPRSATYITKAQIDAVNELPGTDRPIKVVNIGHENFALGIIKRGSAPLAPPVPAGPATPPTGARAQREPCGVQMDVLPAGGTASMFYHENQTEGYYITSGSGVLMTGGYVVNGRRGLSPDLNGPTCGGGVTFGDITKREVHEGDIVVIPAGVPHGWTDIPDHVEYLSFRPSPGILTAGWKSPAIEE